MLQHTNLRSKFLDKQFRTINITQLSKFVVNLNLIITYVQTEI